MNTCIFQKILLAILVILLAGCSMANPSPTTIPFPTAIPFPTVTPSPTITPFPTATPLPTATPSPHFSAVPSGMVFAGKVVSAETGEWPNDRLVVLYLNGAEIARTTTRLSSFDEAQHEITDGTFVLLAENLYQLSAKLLADQKISFGYSEWGNVVQYTFLTKTFFIQKFIYDWVGDVAEGKSNNIYIPSKNVYYTIKVFSGPKDSLPAEIKADGSTQIKNYRAKNPEDHVITLIRKIDGDPGDAKVIKYSDIQSERREILQVPVILNNCGGNAPLHNKYAYTQTFVQQFTSSAEIKFGVEVPVATWLSLVAELKTTFGFEQGVVTSKTIEYDMQANAKTNVVYIIHWSEVLERGQADVSYQKNIFHIPYEAKKDLMYEVTSEEKTCP